jgi:molybdopterin-guanine dinucleotide biosynthesis protein
MGISSPAKAFALINRYTEQELGLFALFEQLNLNQLDLILVEGFKREIFPKIELQRQALNHPNSENTGSIKAGEWVKIQPFYALI